MRGEQYRLRTSTMALVPSGDNPEHCVPLTIPAGSVVEVVELYPDGNRLADVRWEGRAVMMFAVDLRTRGERVVAHVGVSATEPARR